MNLFEQTEDHGLDETKNYLEELVGPDKKFKDPEALARGKAESDNFIARLIKEQEDLRKEVQSRIKMEEFLDKMKQTPGNPNGEPPVDNPPQDPNGRRELDPDKLYEEFKQRLANETREATLKKNYETTVSKLRETYGTNFAQKLEQVASETGASKEELNRLASENPNLLFRLLGDAPTASRDSGDLFAPPSSSVNTQTFKPNSDVRNKSYYDNLKRTNPTVYFSQKTQLEEYQNAMRLGEKFFT